MRPAGLAALCVASLVFGTAHANSPRPEAARIAAATQITPGVQNPYEANPGGKATLRGGFAPARAFAMPLPGLDDARAMDFVLGEAMFQKFWVQSPSSTRASDGLGPLYNARSCAMCHPGNGRGAAPQGDGPVPVSLLMRLSVPGGETHGIEGYLATLPDPEFGGQVQTDAITGASPEGQPSVRYQEQIVDGVALRYPAYDPGMALSDATMMSPRLAPALLGMGLIEAIRPEDILALADPEDADGDGISGRANILPSRDTGQPMLGRYGWKAGNATLRDQVADAFAHDIGISSPLFPEPWGDCTAAQTACRTAPHGDKDARAFELDATGLDLTTAYVAGLAVPERRAPQDVIKGRDLFMDLGCSGCHQPAFVTERRTDDPLRSFQLIWPYSDFLLHDMGPDLADNRPEHRATGREWRTPPLWGMGRTKQVSGTEYFLHDGRARSIREAIWWHGGEALPARNRFRQLDATDRDALIAFLESL